MATQEQSFRGFESVCPRAVQCLSSVHDLRVAASIFIVPREIVVPRGIIESSALDCSSAILVGSHSSG